MNLLSGGRRPFGQWVREEFDSSRHLAPLVLALSVGLVAGLGTIVFRYLLEQVGGALQGEGPSWLGTWYGWRMVVTPALGLMLVSWMVGKWAPEARGHGVPEVMLAVRTQGGRIRGRVAFVKAIASALTIGTGGAVGREGPIVQIGCALGSWIGQRAGLRDSGVRVLVACGAAAAIGGTFNAPLAGVLFAMEVVLADFAARSFGFVAVSAVASTALVRSVAGTETAFKLPVVFALNNPMELVLYLVLGALAGVLARVYIGMVYRTEDAFESWKASPAFRAVIAGVAIGVLGLLTHGDVLGVGYAVIERTMDTELTLGIGMLLLLVVAKMVATSLTLGGGGSGGVFAPALFIGATAGGAFGQAVHWIWPAHTAPPGAYALVGMGALFAGAAHAPITAVFILFEMTDDYKVILPLMLAVVVSHLVSASLNPDSIYTRKLRREGGMRSPRPGLSVLDTLLVTDAMKTDVPTAAPGDRVSDLAARMHREHIRSLPVVTNGDGLIGIVTEHDVEMALVGEDATERTVDEIMTRSLQTCTESETLAAVLHRFAARNVRQIPVVEPGDPPRLRGVIRREELLWAYGEVAEEHEQLLAQADGTQPAGRDEAFIADLEIVSSDRALRDRCISDLGLPSHALVVRMRRAGHDIIPKGATRVEAGDLLTIYTTSDRARELREWIARVHPES